MPYPAETIDGKTVQIVEKGMLGEQEILRATDGGIYKRSATEELKLELVQAGVAVLNTVEEVQVEVEESVTAIVAEAKEALDEMKTAQILDLPAEAQEAVEEIVAEVKEGVEEVGEALKSGVESVISEASDVVDAVQDLSPIEVFEEMLNGARDNETAEPSEGDASVSAEEAPEA